MLHLPLPGTRSQPVPATSNQHHHRHHPAHPAALGTGAPGRSRNKYTRPRPPQPPTRRERVTALITSHPPRDWTGTELAALLDIPARSLHSQLGEWARYGFYTRTGFGSYRLNTPPEPASSTSDPDP